MFRKNMKTDLERETKPFSIKLYEPTKHISSICTYMGDCLGCSVTSMNFPDYALVSVYYIGKREAFKNKVKTCMKTYNYEMVNENGI